MRRMNALPLCGPLRRAGLGWAVEKFVPTYLFLGALRSVFVARKSPQSLDRAHEPDALPPLWGRVGVGVLLPRPGAGSATESRGTHTWDSHDFSTLHPYPGPLKRWFRV